MLSHKLSGLNTRTVYCQRGDIPSLTLLLGHGDPKTLDLKIVILLRVWEGFGRRAWKWSYLPELEN